MKLPDIALLALAQLLILPNIATSQERKIKQSDLPAAVAKAIVAQSQGATVKGYSTEKENGQTMYEAEMTVNGHSKDVLFDAGGVVVEVEEEVGLDAVPPAVKAGLVAKAGKGKILKVESLTKQGKLVAYEAQVMTGKKRSEIQVGPDGKALPKEQ